MKIGDDCSLWFVPSVIAGDVGLSRKIQSKFAEKVYLLLNKEKFSLKNKQTRYLLFQILLDENGS